MPNHYQVIDETTWKRAMHCAVFRDSVEPAFCVTFEADITKFLQIVKRAFLYAFDGVCGLPLRERNRGVPLPLC